MSGRDRDGSTKRDRSVSLPVVVVSALFVILGGFFLGIVLFPLFNQPKSLVPVIAGPAEITVSTAGRPAAGESGPGPVSTVDPAGGPAAGADSLVPFRFLQVGAFSDANNAQDVTAELLGLGMHVYVVPDGELVKVQVGPFRTAGDQRAADDLLRTHGFTAVERELLAAPIGSVTTPEPPAGTEGRGR